MEGQVLLCWRDLLPAQPAVEVFCGPDKVMLRELITHCVKCVPFTL